MAATGVQLGDPLEPLLFALVLHPLIHKIRDNCKPLLDDGTIIGDSEEVVKYLDIIRETDLGLGLLVIFVKPRFFGLLVMEENF
ncbi:hypothetical protein A2U01_0063643, partial [Trifolium medium]|nr:hypothetical protein [Trifolium medium]